MRILAITEYYRRQAWNGSEIFCSRLIDALRVHHEVAVLARSAGDDEAAERIDIAVPDSIVNDADALRRLLVERTAEGAYDVIYNLGALLFGCKVAGLLATAMPEVPLVNHFQALLGPYARIEGMEQLLEQANGIDQQEVAARAASNIFLSDSELLAATEWGFELGSSFATVIPNGLPAEEFRGVQPDFSFLAPRRREETQRPLVVATAGRFSDYSKGADLVYRAFAELHSELPDTFLLSITNSRRFEYLLADLPADSFQIVDWLSRREFLRTLAAVDVVVLPSRYEPFGLIAIEAMFLGLPVVANTVGGLQESVFHDRTGRLSALSNGSLGLYQTLRELASDRERLREMGRAARQRALRYYNIESVLEQVEGALARACLNRRAPAYRGLALDLVHLPVEADPGVAHD